MPVGPYRMPGGGRDGVMRRRDGALARLLHVNAQPAVVRAWVAGGAVRLRAEAPTSEAAAAAIERMRFALGTDQDLSGFHRRFWRDPLLGPILRRRPWLRPRRRPEPFEALAWAICEQLIDGGRAAAIQRRPEPFEALAWAICEQFIDGGRAAAIQRRLVRRHGHTSGCGTLHDVPGAAAVAALSPAEVEACGLSPLRSVTMVRAAREVASGRADLSRHEPAWRRLRVIRGIGSWTVECLALHGQGRDDQLPAGDLAYLKLVGRLRRMGRRATEEEVREFFEPYAPHAGLAGTCLVHGMAAGAFSYR